METGQPVARNYYTPTPSRGVFGTKVPSSVAFGVAILLFLLPFSEMKCGPSTFATKSGLDFSLGNPWKSFYGGFNTKDSEKDDQDRYEKAPNDQLFALAAIALAILGLVLSLASTKAGGIGGGVTGILSAGSLIALMLTVQKWFDMKSAREAVKKASKIGSNAFDLPKSTFDDLPPRLAFTPWFYICIVALIAAAVFSFLRTRANRQ